MIIVKNVRQDECGRERKVKKIVIGTLAVAIVLGGSFGSGSINHGYAEEDSAKVKTVQAKKLIGTKKAKAVALKKVKGKVEDVELEKEGGKRYYEVDIDRENKEYEVHVDAYSAKILKVEKDSDDDDDRDGKVSKSVKKSIISKTKAIAIAKKRVNGKVIEIEKDDDDGRYKYEIKLRTKKGEAEIKIDAVTGKVLEVEFDD